MAYQPVRQPRLADVITERLEALILEGSLTPGQRLPPERELAERFGVSRPSLREAIQKLAARGLLVSRQGGGTYITESLNSGYSDPLLEMLSRHGEFHLDLLEFRDAMEGLSAYYAALRSTPTDKALLIQRFEELEVAFLGEDPKGEAKADAAFHLAIAESAHNVLLLHTIRGIFHLLERSIVDNLAHLFEKPESRPRLMTQHRALLDAILEGRAEDAQARSHEHLVYVEEGLLEMERAETRAQRALRRAQVMPPRRSL
ncbi:GntR family transcriptional regulator [Halomonas denitrificans]|uniref:GntR family transcriptional regulator n=1 Tax=Halomonas TaxID=2745 RepID=UPI001A8D7C9D|nr:MULTISPECIES: GntR family transcriptional regulator [Halomonas]MED5295946.1 GntR family transcriptional regulator [Pseudomonadota bacterium]MBN8413086.1 GntR family transcriptional regulator [Halomonas litopenaei]MBY5925384.1 GntR family transcriptional regulator [Halomonas sp. DP4Y7-2]MBY5929214.1 GntR family transcriptional regulator [Halomonas sp. DP8Y7-3]MBY5968292.1 GntR family transcriptional regulator [Halomonas denitrificans]